MSVRQPVGGRGWLLTDLWVLERRVTGNETRRVPCHGHSWMEDRREGTRSITNMSRNP